MRKYFFTSSCYSCTFGALLRSFCVSWCGSRHRAVGRSLTVLPRHRRVYTSPFFLIKKTLPVLLQPSQPRDSRAVIAGVSPVFEVTRRRERLTAEGPLKVHFKDPRLQPDRRRTRVCCRTPTVCQTQRLHLRHGSRAPGSAGPAAGAAWPRVCVFAP